MAINRPATLAVGTKVNDRYTITAVVGQGGLGTVYQVNEDTFGQGNTYALKETFDLSEGARDQFEREARWLARLDHPNIPRVRHYFEWNDRLYLVMDFVTGENLEYKLVRGNSRPLNESDVLRWIVPIAGALSYLHLQHPPLIHRDVKPANIIVTPSGHPALVDLGIAKEHMPGLPNLTATFIRKAGTEGYAPPEQYTSNGTTGPWSDIYSLGATMYHLLTGHVPASAIERAALDGQLFAPRKLNPALSVQTEAVIMRSLAIRPNDRFPTMQEMAQAIEVALTGQASRPLTMPTMPQFHCPRCNRPMLSQAPLCAECARELSQISGPLRLEHPSVPHTIAAAPPWQQQSDNMSRQQSAPNMMRPQPQPPSNAPQAGANSQPSRRVSRGAIERRRGATVASPSDSLPRPNNSSPRLATNSDALRRPPRTTTSAPLREVPGGQRRSAVSWQVIAAVCAMLMVTVGILIGTHVISFGGTVDVSTPKAAVSGYFDALQSQDYQRAYNYLSNHFTSSETYDQFTAAQKSDTTNLGGITSYSIVSIVTNGIDNDEAKVNVKRGATMFTYTIELSNNNSKWLIDSVNS